MMRRSRLTILSLALVALLSSCTSGGDKAKGNFLGSDSLIQSGPGENYVPKGELVADLGFRPEANGFGFQNYGEGPYENMTADDVRSLFGDAVCAYLKGETCELTPPAAQWMEQTNLNMSGGHCYGFSVSSLLFFNLQQDPKDFGANDAPSIPLDGNTAIQRNLATTWAFQVLPDVNNAVVRGAPNEILDKLVESLHRGASELYTIAIFQADGTGGHAVTPYAVEDRGDGTFAVLVYDNNYPKVTRAILFNREENAWGYNAATNPEEKSSDYLGNAETNTISLYPTSPALDQNLTCPFCEGGAAAFGVAPAGMIRAADVEYNQVILTGDPTNHGHLLITDENDKRTGWVDGTYVNEIPGAQVHRPLMDIWDQAVEPIIDIPSTIDFEITIDGSELTEPDMTSVSVIGPGFEMAVEDINLNPDQVDKLIIASNGTTLQYTTKSDESPFIDVGIVGDKADFEFAFAGVDMKGGGEITAALDPKDEILAIATEGGSGGTYALGIRRIDDKGEQVFSHDDIELKPGESAGVAFGQWANNGSGVPLIISRKGGDETITLTDEGDKEQE